MFGILETHVLFCLFLIQTPEWNEVFGFDCNEDDQYLNVCVWCKMAQTDRNRKQIATKGEDSKLQVADMLERYYVTKKIGYVRKLSAAEDTFCNIFYYVEKLASKF